MKELIKDFLLTWRKCGVVIAAFAGVVLLVIVYRVFIPTDYEKVFPSNNESFMTSGYLILLALPLSFYLWFLRNEDKLVQIKYQRENNHFNSFSHAVSLFADKEDRVKNALGLRLLVKLKKQGLFEKEVDMTTSCGKNLSGIKLPGEDLSGINLERAVLTEANLSGADLTGADLTGAVLTEANLSGADLTGADLSRVNFSKAVLTDANFSKAVLTDANFSGADLTGAVLTEANLSRADLTGADLSRVNFSKAVLTDANFSGAIFLIREQGVIGASIALDRLSTYLWYRGMNSTPYPSPVPVKTVFRNGKYYFEKFPPFKT